MKKRILILTSLFLLVISSTLSARAIVKPKKPVVLRSSVITSKTINQVVTKEILFDLDELSIKGTLTLPKEDGYYPLVIIDSSAKEGEKDFNKAMASFVSDLTNEGIASFTFDYDDIKGFDYSIIVKITDYLGDLEEINQSRIGLLGWDEGANNVLLAALNSSSQTYESLAIWSPTLLEEKIPTTKVIVNYRSSFAFNRGFGWKGPKPVTKKLVYTNNLEDTLDYIDELKMPIASFYGMDDKDSSISISEKIYDLSSNKQSKLIAIEDADHTFDYFTKDLSKFEELKENTLNWFVDTLK